MILVTVGTSEQPFDRLVRAAAELGGSEELLVQHGSSTVPPGRGRWVDFLPFHELEQHAREARVVVCHAGVGSIMLARRAGRRPVVMARRHRLWEAVDDHRVRNRGELQERPARFPAGLEPPGRRHPEHATERGTAEEAERDRAQPASEELASGDHRRLRSPV